MLGLSCTSGLAPIKKKLSIAIILLLSLEHGLLGFRGGLCNGLTLAKEALTKRAQSELFLKVLLKLARIHRLMTDFVNNDSNDADFSKVFDGKAAAELLPLLKELDALSPQFRVSIKTNTSLTDFLKRLSSEHFGASVDDLHLLKNLIDQLQNCQRKELSTP
jgi:hypothetical protein